MISATFPIKLTSEVNEFNPPFIPRGVLVTNHSADNIAFDNTVDPVVLVPPGVVVPIVINHLVSTLRVRSATNTTGAATIQIMDSEPDTSNAPALQQLPGTITATIPSTVTVGGTVGLNPGTSVAITGPVSLSGSVTIGNAISIAAGQSVNIGTVAGTVTITGSVGITGNVTIGNAISIAAGQSVNVGSIGSMPAITGSVSILGSVTIGTAISIAAGQSVNIGSITNTVSVANAVIEGNTTALAGVLANTVVSLTLTPNTQVNQTIAKAIQGFALVLGGVGTAPDGFLDVWFTASGVDSWLVRKVPFHSLMNNTWTAIEKTFNADIPAGAVLHLLMSQTQINTSAMVKY